MHRKSTFSYFRKNQMRFTKCYFFTFKNLPLSRVSLNGTSLNGFLFYLEIFLQLVKQHDVVNFCYTVY